MKKIVSLVLAISMVLSMFVTSLAASVAFPDVNNDYAAAVDALVKLGVVNGMPDGTFKPENEVTRAELAKMLVICLGLGEDSAEALKDRTIFTDSANHWGNGYINLAAQSKVIAGYPDGTFKPDKNVSYAEAVTMVIRALGYGNVVDAEGTWPTAYMLKAVELDLLEDLVGEVKSAEAANRGNIAVLLWNMLRTPMWKITSESEGTGMTSSNQGREEMLEVKFPDYKYYDDAYLASVVVNDDEVKATISGDEGTQTALIKDMDIARLVIGMRVSALVSEWKDKEDAEFLTITPAYTMVEGVVTKISEDKDKIEINGDEEYKVNAANLAINDYVVAEVDGNKVAHIKTLPTTVVEMKTETTIESEIANEDALVIIDGEWATREDVEVDSMVTAISEYGDPYYMVSTERETGEFDAYTVEKGTTPVAFVEIDGEEHRLTSFFKAYDGEKNNTTVKIADLKEEEENNKYIGAEVEYAVNYLGQVVVLYFGEVSEKNAGNFYSVVSDGVYTNPDEKGTKYYITLVGADGEAVQYQLEKASLAAPFGVNENSTVFSKGNPVYVWAEFDEDVITVLEVVDSGDKFDNKYVVEYFSGDVDKYDYLANASASKVTSSTVVYTTTPVKDKEEKDVIDMEVEVTEGAEALNGVPGGLVVYDETKSTTKAKFVFISEEAKSKDLNFGIVTGDVKESSSVNYVPFAETNDADDAEYLEVDKKDNFTYTKGNVVAYTVNNEKVTGKLALAPADLDNDASIVEDVDGSIVTLYKENAIDLVRDEEDYEDYEFALVNVKLVNKKVEFASVEALGKGINSVEFDVGDRLVKNTSAKVMFVVRGISFEEVYKNGEFVGARSGDAVVNQPTQTPEQQPEQQPEQTPEVVKYTVTYEVSGDEGAFTPSGDSYAPGAEVTLPVLPTSGDYVYSNWTTDYEGLDLSTSTMFIMPSGDVVVKSTATPRV